MVDISDLQAKFGSVTIQDFGNLPFRCYAANLIVGGQGLRRGQYVEIFGAEGSGKSTLLYELLGIAAGQGCVAILLDQEHCADGERLAKFGLVKGKNLVYLSESTLEALFEKQAEIFETIRKTNPQQPIVVGLDSLGITLPQAHYDKFFEDKKTKVNIDLKSNEKTAANAKAWAKMLRAFFARFHDMNITTIVLNHQTEVIDVGPFGGGGPKYTTPGGRTQKHMMFTRIQLIPIGKIKGQDDRIIGNKVLMKTHKCKDAPPFQEVELPLYFGNPELPPEKDYAGTFDCGACFHHLKKHGALKGSGWYTLDLMLPDGSVKTVKFQGEDGFRQVYLENQEAVYYTMMRWHYNATNWAL